MEAISGTWKLVSVENLEAYSDAIGTLPEFKEKAKKLLSPEANVTQEITVSGTDSVVIKTTVPGKTFEVRATLGEKMKVMFLDGRTQQSVFRWENGRLIEEQSGEFVSTNTRYIEGENLVMEMKAGNGVTTTRKYVKV